MQKIKLVCFDLDHTLIYEIHSVMYPCILNGKYNEVLEVEKNEENGVYNWIEADYHRATLIKGLHIESLKKNFDSIIKPIKNIKQTIDKLHEKGIKCILITAGPIQVAKVAAERWGIDFYYGSLYEVENDLFTGKILEHTGDKGKLAHLIEHCEKSGYKSEECLAVGDGGTDIPIFEYCGASLAINYADSIIGKAKYFIKTDDLTDILEYVV
jgi:phosphoserine phosphatase